MESSRNESGYDAGSVIHSIICLVSALSFHEITTQIPNAVDIAILRGTTISRIDYPPTRVHRFREPSFSIGVLEHL